MNSARRLLLVLALSILALGLATAPAVAASLAYTLNYEDDTVAAIDTQTNQVVGTPIKVGDGPYTIAITPDGTRAYVGNSNEETISVIDLQTNQVVGTPIPFPAQPNVIAISPDGKTAYATTSAGTVSVLDLQTNQVVGEIAIEEGGPGLWGIALAPDGNTAYVVNEGGDTLAVVDLATGKAVGTPIPTGEGPINVALTPDGKWAYVTNEDSSDVSVIDTQTRQDVATIPVGESPWGLAITPDGKKAYVANYGENTVSVIDTQTNQVVGTPIPTAEEPYEVAITPNGRTAYVANYGGQSVTAIDTQTDQPTTIPDPGGPWQVVVAPDKSPVPSFSTSQAPSGGPVAFNGLASSDPDGSIASFNWTFGDGTTAVNGGSSPSHEYTTAGTYAAALSVTDNEGCSISLVFTGRTAYCNGSSLVSHTVTVLPSNRFGFGKVKKNKRKGTARLQIKVPGAGALVLTGKKVRVAKTHAAKAGKVMLTIRPKVKANKTLKRRHHLKVRLRVKFTPIGGNPSSKSKALALVRRR
ncbi:MAG TPA: PKD domain-containing protein [Solirubrobacterales bacterium]|jgi:YVTN family beta-propeller protein|nr:PKD domain-containing protein [Solirubrobacterales bacterium]